MEDIRIFPIVVAQHVKKIAYNPQKNGIAEIMNRTLLEVIQFILNSNNMAKDCQGTAVVNAA